MRMGRPDDQPENLNLGKGPESEAADRLLQSMTQDLKNLQQDLVAQLHQDIRRLQTEKSRLLNDIEKLQHQQQTLQSQYDVTLSRQQLAQQQAWAKQLALALANHLQLALSQRLSQMGSYPVQGPNLPQIPATGDPENTRQAIASLDDTVNRAFASLRNDLNSYQSTLSQQLNRMQELGQQGETILEVLVSRISQQLQREMTQAVDSRDSIAPQTYEGRESSVGATGAVQMPIPPRPSPASSGPSISGRSSTPSSPSSGASGTLPNSAYAPVGNHYTDNPNVSPQPQPTSPPQGPPTILPTAPGMAPEPAMAPVRTLLQPRKLSQFQLGLVMILCSTLALSLHNVVVGIVGNPSKLFGVIPIGGYISIRSFGSSLFILWMRMLVVVPLMAWLAGILYRPAWQDIRYFFESKDRRLMSSVVGSGFFLFLSQVLIYIAIGQIGPGVAVTILFMYPIVTVPLAWVLFGDRPNRFRVIVMLTILSGVILTALPKISATASLSLAGIAAAMASGTFFACYLVSMQISFRKLHPVPVSLIQFASIFILTSISLIVLGIEVTPTDRFGLFVSGIILGALTLIGYLLNNFGVRFMGAARASILAASGPVLTAFLAFLIIPGELTALYFIQLVGILIVTLGVTALSFERILIQNRRESRQPSRSMNG